MPTRRRADDSADANDFKKRRYMDWRTMFYIIAALTGGKLSDFGIDMVSGKEYVQDVSVINERISKNSEEIRRLDYSLRNYIQYHGKEEDLNEKRLTEKLDMITENIHELKKIVQDKK